MNNQTTAQQAWEYLHPHKKYYEHMLKCNTKSNKKNIKEKDYANLNVEYKSFDPTIIKDLGSLDVNYKRLMRS